MGKKEQISGHTLYTVIKEDREISGKSITNLKRNLKLHQSAINASLN